MKNRTYCRKPALSRCSQLGWQLWGKGKLVGLLHVERQTVTSLALNFGVVPVDDLDQKSSRVSRRPSSRAPRPSHEGWVYLIATDRDSSFLEVPSSFATLSVDSAKLL
jgi:hypothetical protein